MDVEQYISSGILELYVAGALEEDAMIEVAQNIKLHKKIKDEVRLIEKAVFMLLEVASQNNESGDAAHQLKNHLINRIKDND